jgi:S1-C subfamily serine protease
MADRDIVVAKLRSTFGDNLKDLEERLSTTEEADLPRVGAAADHESALPGVTRASDQARRSAVQDGTRGLRKVNDGREQDLTPAERTGLEAIILLEGRPPLFIQNGDFLRVPEKWKMLNRHRAKIKASIARVGRIDVTGHPEFEWLGTGFLAGPDAIITNRHVAEEFARTHGDGWRFRSGMSARLDFNEEHGAIDPLEFKITGIFGIHRTHDLAVLRVAATGGPGSALPEPLTIATAKPGRVTGREVYVIGYPAMDGRRNDPDEMQRIFSGVYNVKRLQPGLISGWSDGDDVFRHDCSTLGGNSGSPVFDLATHAVVGLHFGGRYLIGNNAVPLWRLAGDPLLRAAGVNFG